MSGETLYLLFNYEAGKGLDDTSRLVEMMRALITGGGFRIADPGSNANSSHIQLADLLRAAWERAMAQGKHGASMDILDLHGFSMSFGVSFDNYRWLYLFIDSGKISDPYPSCYRNVRSMVQAAEIIYQATSPYYGFGLSSPSTFSHPGPDDREANIDAVWDYNFFGPKLVKTFGSEILRSVPTWRTVEFDDGGILLEMSQSPIVNWKEEVRNYESAAGILGLRTFHQGG